MSSNRNVRNAAVLALGLAAGLGLAAAAAAQPVIMPRLSPGASVSQTIGMTDVTLRYSRPGVKERKIWGGLVPYGEVWRTGANENTTIQFSTPVKLEGKELPAGIYGLQTIPTEGKWTLILSKDADLWGAFDYKPEHDALRVELTPQPAEHEERMKFEFEDVTDSSATVVLRWEKIAVPFKIETDTMQQVEEKMNQAMRWQTAHQAVLYCVQSENPGCLEDASRWLDASIALNGNFYNYRTKANMMAKKGDRKAAADAAQ